MTLLYCIGSFIAGVILATVLGSDHRSPHEKIHGKGGMK